MTTTTTLKFLLLAGFVSLIDPETAIDLGSTDQVGVITAAEARVGRPLTPVSVAGVARRTTRRCAAGVYNC
jgi:hypothetical protein